MKKLLIPVLFGIFLVGCGNPEKYEVADISDFDYSISGDSVILESYEGNNKYLEIPSTYEISGSQYNVDLNEFKLVPGLQHLFYQKESHPSITLFLTEAI